MIQARNRPGFALETLPEAGFARKLVGQYFDRDSTAEPRVFGPIHFSHATRTDGHFNLVRPESCSWAKAHGNVPEDCRPCYHNRECPSVHSHETGWFRQTEIATSGEKWLKKALGRSVLLRAAHRDGLAT